MKSQKSILALTFAFLFIATSAYAQEIVGDVVGISDGDTIKVLQNKTQYKIRLYGIDTPERKQAFGNKARQFLADLVFRKKVRVVEEDVDRYGRIVGRVYVGNTFVNEEIIELPQDQAVDGFFILQSPKAA